MLSIVLDLPLYGAVLMLSLASLETGLPAQKQQDEEKMTFNEMNELFGKQFVRFSCTHVWTVFVLSQNTKQSLPPDPVPSLGAK